MNADNQINRRAHERFTLTPMYTTVTAIREASPFSGEFEGHAYDISETGIRFELDEPLNTGEAVTLRLTLPCESESVSVSGDVVWVNDADDDPGPRRMAVHFRGFHDQADRFRLLNYLGNGKMRRAA